MSDKTDEYIRTLPNVSGTIIGAWDDAEPLTDERLAEIRHRFDNDGEVGPHDAPELFAELYRLRAAEEQDDAEVCETCEHWKRWPAACGVESQSGTCEQFARDGLDCPMFATEFCSRWKRKL